MIETYMASYLEEQTGISCVVGARAQRNGINIMNTGTIANNYYLVELKNLQISIRNEDLDICNEWVESVLAALRGIYGKFGASDAVIFIESIGSLIYEDDGTLCHIPIFINAKIV
jgi:hypothetical protein